MLWTFAFTFNLRHYTAVPILSIGEMINMQNLSAGEALVSGRASQSVPMRLA
jgi:hypothetical protein